MDEIPPLLQSAFDKLDRAQAHIDQLNLEFPVWLRDAYTIRTEFHFQRGEVRRYVTWRDRMPPHWGIVLGDCVHDLRSALDHLAWALTVHHQRKVPMEPLPPIPTNCPWRKVAFPIRLTAPSHWPPRSLSGVDPSLHARFRDVQPFTASSERRARRRTLWILEELWNRDKHRSVLGVDAAIAVRTTFVPEEVLLFGIVGEDFPDISVSDIEFFSGGQIAYGEETQAIRIAFDGGIPAPQRLHAYLKKYANLVCDIELDKGAPGYGHGARRLLRQVHRDIAAILRSFIPEFDPARRISHPRDHCPPFV